MEATRRSFLLALSSTAAVVGGAALVGCGDDSSGDDDDDSGTGTGSGTGMGTGTGSGTSSGTSSGTGSGTPSGQGACAETTAAISINHGHELNVSSADVMAEVDKIYDIMGSGDHTHQITVTAADFAALQSGETIVVTSSTDVSHSHDVTVSCV